MAFGAHLKMFATELLNFVVFLIVFQLVLSNSESLARYYKTKCSTDADCNKNAFCFANDNGVLGYCKCQNGYEMYVEDKYYECVSEEKLGNECRRSLQCQISAGPLAICNRYNTNGVCVCNNTISHEVNGECYQTKYLNDFCLVDENCLLPESQIGEEKQGLCYYGVCSCRLGKRPAKNNKSCIVTKKMDEKCDNDIQCQGTDNAVCRTVCLCGASFTRSKDGQKCLRAALKFGEPCSENEQCSRYLESSICRNNECTCSANFHGYETRCRKNTKPDEACFDDAECIIFKELENKVNCTKGVCTCTFGKSYDNLFCLSNAPYCSRKENKLLVLGFLIVIFYNFI